MTSIPENSKNDNVGFSDLPADIVQHISTFLLQPDRLHMRLLSKPTFESLNAMVFANHLLVRRSCPVQSLRSPVVNSGHLRYVQTYRPVDPEAIAVFENLALNNPLAVFDFSTKQTAPLPPALQSRDLALLPEEPAAPGDPVFHEYLSGEHQPVPGTSHLPVLHQLAVPFADLPDWQAWLPTLRAPLLNSVSILQNARDPNYHWEVGFYKNPFHLAEENTILIYCHPCSPYATTVFENLPLWFPGLTPVQIPPWFDFYRNVPTALLRAVLTACLLDACVVSGLAKMHAAGAWLRVTLRGTSVVKLFVSCSDNLIKRTVWQVLAETPFPRLRQLRILLQGDLPIYDYAVDTETLTRLRSGAVKFPRLKQLGMVDTPGSVEPLCSALVGGGALLQCKELRLRSSSPGESETDAPLPQAPEYPAEPKFLVPKLQLLNLDDIPPRLARQLLRCDAKNVWLTGLSARAIHGLQLPRLVSLNLATDGGLRNTLAELDAPRLLGLHAKVLPSELQDRTAIELLFPRARVNLRLH